MTHPLACRVCPFLDWKDKLSLKDVAEYEALDQYVRAHKQAPRGKLFRYSELGLKRYFPLCDLERMGAA